MKCIAAVVLFCVVSSALGAYELQVQSGVPIKKNFLDAFVACASKGLILVILDTTSKDNDLRSFVSKYAIAYSWIAATDLITEDEFVWMTTGEPVTNGEDAWHAGEPNNTNEQDCANLGFQGIYTGWDDLQCDGYADIPFICETASDEAVALAKSNYTASIGQEI